MSRASKGFRIAGNLIKFTAAAIVMGVIALLLWRILSAGTPASLKAMTPNDSLAEAYETYGNDLYIFKQDHYSVTTAERNRGYFAVTDYYVIPEANQIQLVFRYNNSTVRATAEDYSLPELPSLDDELYDVTLLLQTDLTPDNGGDNAGNVEGTVAYTRLYPTSVERERTNLYNYFRYVFEFDEAGLSLSDMLENDELLAVYADVYYNQDIDYSKTAYGSLFLYDYKTDVVKQRLTASDRRAIKDYIKG